MCSLQGIHIFIANRQSFLEIGFGIQHDHGSHQLGNGSNRQHGIGVLFIEHITCALILHQHG